MLVFICSSGHGEIAVGSHSHILFVLMNAVLKSDDEELMSWFATGEARTVDIRVEGDLQAEEDRINTESLTVLSTAAAPMPC